MTIELNGTYKPARGHCRIKVVKVIKIVGAYGKIETRVLFDDGSSSRATDFLELLLRKEIVRT